MSLPFVKITERLRPDDVLSADHMQKLVDTANDGDELLTTQHGPGIGARAGLHIGYAPPVHIGTLIVSPPAPGTDRVAVRFLAGYIDEASLKWEVGEGDPTEVGIVPDPDEQHYFSFATPGDRYSIVGAEVQSSFWGTPSPTAAGAGKSNMFMVRPAIQVGPAPGEVGKTRVSVYFGPTYAGGGGNFVTDLEQFTCLVHGIPRGG